ncbi:hypothetical protein ACOME3_003102 [Neoechinorhynchus agilis]
MLQRQANKLIDGENLFTSVQKILTKFNSKPLAAELLSLDHETSCSTHTALECNCHCDERSVLNEGKTSLSDSYYSCSLHQLKDHWHHHFAPFTKFLGSDILPLSEMDFSNRNWISCVFERTINPNRNK